MRVPLKWLSEYVDVAQSAQELSDLLTMAGLQVELIEKVGADCTGVVAGRVEKKERHPNADKLSLCVVSTGSAQSQVVCGAPNVEEGGVYPFAPIGAVLPGNFKIKRAKLRGVESEGMLCSARELGLSEDADGLLPLPRDSRPGAPIEEILGAPDTVLELSITPNRPDCLSLVGVAREVAALTGATLRLPDTSGLREHGPIGDHLSVELAAADGCPRYSARVVRGVSVRPSPVWMQRHLQAAGLRPINNVVDVTNFVMLETGHPMHAFDARYVHGNRIVIRWAAAGESITTLDGTALALTTQDLLIADAERGVALAGIMGGQNSEIRDDTTNVVLEAAYFDPVTIRRSSRRLRIHTDSSHRFERGCDPNATLRVLDRAALLLQELAGGETAGGRIDCYPRPIAPRQVTVRPARVNQLLGTDLPPATMTELLQRLQMQVTSGQDGTLRVDVPTFRPDVELEEDVIEEVARLHGYDNIPVQPPLVRALPVEDVPVLAMIRQVRAELAGMGLEESLHLSFTATAPTERVSVANPLAEESGGLRSNLAESLVSALQFNLNRQNRPAWLFEISRVFAAHTATGEESPFSFKSLPTQPYHVALLVSGTAGSDWRSGARPVDFHTIKGLVEALGRRLRLALEVRPLPEGAAPLPPVAHPSRRAGVWHQQSCLGFVAELSPDAPLLKRYPVPVALAELDLELIAALPQDVPRHKPLPAFPKAERDLAVLLPAEVRHETVEAAIRSARIPFLEAVSLFDVFTGKNLPAGKKSVAFNLAFRAPERTLTDAEVDDAMQKIVERVRETGGELR
ncbi:MAG: phenylalanine--tRNA ligase subunit beta [Candidatus Wallbacteria bacterium]|nr:phenylalanine--tRNA ligase subunit beta [Candidatus Wallbacteria bacterium]